MTAFYAVRCDKPRCKAFEWQSYCEEEGWQTKGDKHYCPEHVGYEYESLLEGNIATMRYARKITQ